MGIDDVVHDVSLQSIHLRNKLRRHKKLCKDTYPIIDKLSKRETFRLATLTPIPCDGDLKFASHIKSKRSALIRSITDTPAPFAQPIKVRSVPDLYNTLAGGPRFKPVWEPTNATDLPSHVLESATLPSQTSRPSHILESTTFLNQTPCPSHVLESTKLLNQTPCPSQVSQANTPPCKTTRTRAPHFPKPSPLVVAERALDALYISDRAYDEVKAARAHVLHKHYRCCARARRSERRRKLISGMA